MIGRRVAGIIDIERFYNLIIVNILISFWLMVISPPVFNAGLLLVLVALVFVRIGYVYPSRTPELQRTTLGLGAVWALMMLAVIYRLPNAPAALVIASLFFPVYYAVLSFWLHARRRS